MPTPRLLRKLKDGFPDGTDPGRAAALADFSLLGSIVGAVLDALLEHRTSLSRALDLLSLAAHGLMVLFYHHGTAFIAGQTYHAFQSTVKDLYVLTAMTQQLCPEHALYFFLAGSNELEKLFGILRTVTHDSNFDMLQLGDRAAGVLTVLEILQRNPNWNQLERRLKPESDDKVNIKSWEGNMAVEGVVLAQCWKRGRDEAVALLDAHPWWASKEITAQWFVDRHREGLTMMRPKGVLVGVSSDQGAEGQGEELGPGGGPPAPQTGGEEGHGTSEPLDLSNLLEELLACEASGGG
jgi:hypothetical protein